MEELGASTHQRQVDGSLTPTDWGRQQEPLIELGGGLYSTAGDYLQFVRMILNRGSANGSQVLQPATVDLMAQNAMGDIRVTMLETQPRTLAGRRVLPGPAQELGAELHDQRGDGADRPARGQPRLGRDPEQFFWIDPTTRIGGSI
jgi:CubicO group peptidase (beta-lactamase class C family)